MKQQLIRLERVAGELNAWLFAIAIGLAVLDFTVLVAKCVPPLPRCRLLPVLTARGKRWRKPPRKHLHLSSDLRGEEAVMQTIVGPVVVTKEGGFGFDLWTSEEGLSRGFSYRCIEDAYHARKFEIRSRTQCLAGAMTACSTLDEFASALARR